MNVFMLIYSIVFFIIIGMLFLLKIRKKKEKFVKKNNQIISNTKSKNKKEIKRELGEIESNNKQADLTSATELLLKNSIGNELVFKRPNFEASKTKKYQEVVLSNVNQISGSLINIASPVIQQMVTIDQLAKIAPNGLFTTIVNPSTLSKFSDGSYTTMVRNTAGNLVEHEGFTKVINLMKVNPIMAVTVGIQAMAAISGQYYLHQINSQLKSISGKLDDLINYHNDEKIGVLFTVREQLLKIASKQIVDNHDIDEIRALLKDSRNVYAEYRVRLSRQQEELAIFESKAIFGKNRIIALEEKIKELNFTTKIVYESDQLSLQAEISEIAVRMKIGDNTLIIQELLEQMKQTYEYNFCSDINNFIRNEYRLAVKERYKKLGKKYLLKHPEKLKQINNLIKQPELKLLDSNIGELSKQLLFEQNKEQEILYIPSRNLDSHRVFVPVFE